jgi:acyl-CoA thioester hydrolase
MGSADDRAGEEPAASDFPVHRRFTTRWADNDVHGHLNNVVYYEFFDSAVNGWLIDAAGMDIRKLSAIGVVAETSCRYLHEISVRSALAALQRPPDHGRAGPADLLGA